MSGRIRKSNPNAELVAAIDSLRLSMAADQQLLRTSLKDFAQLASSARYSIECLETAVLQNRNATANVGYAIQSYVRRSELDRKAGERIAWRKCKAIADQVQTHRRETTALVTQNLLLKEALTGAVKLLTWVSGGGRGNWSPANTQQLKEWKELCEP